MAWTVSAAFRQFNADVLKGTLTTADLDLASMLKIALYNNTITPDKDVTAALSAYNAATSQWLTANEQFQAGQWAQGGVTLANNTVTTPSTGVVMLDADDAASGTACTLSNVYGGLVYCAGVSTPVASQGLAFLYFGGTAFSVTNGTLTVVFNANGLVRWTS